MSALLLSELCRLFEAEATATIEGGTGNLAEADRLLDIADELDERAAAQVSS